MSLRSELAGQPGHEGLVGLDLLVSCCQRRPNERKMCLVAAATVVTVLGRRPTHRSISAVFDNGCNVSHRFTAFLTDTAGGQLADLEV